MCAQLLSVTTICWILLVVGMFQVQKADVYNTLDAALNAGYRAIGVSSSVGHHTCGRVLSQVGRQDCGRDVKHRFETPNPGTVRQNGHTGVECENH